MITEFNSINLRDYYCVLAVWEFQPRAWELITLTRLNLAKRLCENHPDRLVFTYDVDPNHLWQRHRGSRPVCKASKPVKSCELILDLIETSPSQSVQAITERLNLSASTVKRNLKQLESKEKVYFRICPISGRTRLYHPVPDTRRTNKPARMGKEKQDVLEKNTIKE